MSLKVEPIATRCGVGPCPGVYNTGRKTLAVVGKPADPELLTALSGNVGEDEIVVEIPDDLVSVTAV